MTVRQQVLQFAAAPAVPAAIDLDEALANARRADTTNREFRENNPAHLPPESRLPDLYALCPGCQLHPGGGIYPAEELLRSEGCPAGARLRAQLSAEDLLEEGEGRRAEREGPPDPVLKRRDSALPSSLLDLSATDRLRGGSFTRSEALTPESLPETGHRRSPLIRAMELCSHGLEGLRVRVGRAWYFHRRAAVCRKRLSRIASAASSYS